MKRSKLVVSRQTIRSLGPAQLDAVIGGNLSAPPAPGTPTGCPDPGEPVPDPGEPLPDPGLPPGH